LRKLIADLVLLEPAHSRDARSSIEELLREKNLSPQTIAFRTVVDALHVLEYLALVMTKDELRKRVDELRARNGALIDEAIELAKILAVALPEEEVERNLVQKLLDSLDIRIRGLFEFTKR
jgi:adenine-specific DNA methylase